MAPRCGYIATQPGAVAPIYFMREHLDMLLGHVGTRKGDPITASRTDTISATSSPIMTINKQLDTSMMRRTLSPLDQL